MNRPHLSSDASADLDEIWSYIAQDNPLAADRLARRFFDAFDLLAERPRLGRARPEVRPGLRSYVEYPYIIFYYPISDGIMVARVVHGSRDLPSDIDPLAFDP